MAHDTTLFVGLDVHKDSITAACIGSDPAALPVDLGTFGTQQYAIDRLIKKLSGRVHLRFVYEAGPCGFWLQLAGPATQRFTAAQQRPRLYQFCLTVGLRA